MSADIEVDIDETIPTPPTAPPKGRSKIPTSVVQIPTPPVHTVTEEDNKAPAPTKPVVVVEKQLDDEYKWGWVELQTPQTVRESPLKISVNGVDAYFPYGTRVLAQKFMYVFLTKYCYTEGHRIVRDPTTGKNKNKFQQILHAANWEPLESEYQTKNGFARYMQKNPTAILAGNARNMR